MTQEFRRLFVATSAGRSITEGSRRLSRRVRHAVGLNSAPALDPRLATLEPVFRAPPLTPELVGAIKLISPHLDFAPTEGNRAVWEADHNGACWGEYEALAPLFTAMPTPARVLEIGPGMGRSIVFFSKKAGWDDAEVHAYEGDGTNSKYTVRGPRSEDSFCGNIDVLQHILDFNKVKATVFSASDVSVRDLPGPYDVIYSFFAIGYHWSLEHFLDDILSIMGDQSVAIFTVPPNFRPFSALDDLHCRVIDSKPVWPKNARLKLLVLSKSEIPDRR